MSTSNKVRFGLKNVYFSVATFTEDGDVTYATPIRMPGAVNLSMSANGTPDNFWADNVAYYTLNNNGGYDGSLELALVPQSFREQILNEELDDSGVLAENAEAELTHFALLFQFEADQKAIRHVLYNCTCSRPSVEGQTIEDTREVKTETLELSATALSNGYVKAKTTPDTDSSVYDAWFDAVYLPTGTSSSGGTTTDDSTTDEETE